MQYAQHSLPPVLRFENGSETPSYPPAVTPHVAHRGIVNNNLYLIYCIFYPSILIYSVTGAGCGRHDNGTAGPSNGGCLMLGQLWRAPGSWHIVILHSVNITCVVDRFRLLNL